MSVGAMRWLVGMLAVMAGGATLLFAPLLTYRSVASPDGQFTAVAKTSLFRTFTPAMPGQAGDKSGTITVFRRDGRSCGSTPIEMASMISGMRWQLDGKPREAAIVATAVWNLDECTVAVLER
jgi:hypothetical protein